MVSSRPRNLRLAVVQLDVVPQARKLGLWEPAEPRMAEITSAGPEDRQRLSVGGIFAESGPAVYQHVQDMLTDAIMARLREILDFTEHHHADVVVFPEYAIPVGCVTYLMERSAGSAIVAGVGRIRNAEDARMLGLPGPTSSTENLVERNVSILAHQGNVRVITKRYLAEQEDAAEGNGPVVETLQLAGGEVRLGVAVCLDYLRSEDMMRDERAQIVCIPAYTSTVDPFRPDAPRDHVRLFANCAQHGGSSIMLPGLANNPLGDRIGVRPIADRHEAVVMAEYDRYPTRPTSFATPANKLILRSQILEEGSDSETLFGRLNALFGQSPSDRPLTITNLVADAKQMPGSPGPLAEGLDELGMSLRQEMTDQYLLTLTRTQLVVEEGNRPAEIRLRQADYVWEQLNLRYQRDPKGGLGRALDFYQSTHANRLIFDRNSYVDRVLRRYQGGTGALPPTSERYGLDQRHLNATDEEIRRWIENVKNLWGRQASNRVSRLDVVSRWFIQADDDLQKKPYYSDMQWWRDQIRAAASAAIYEGSDYPHEPAASKPLLGPSLENGPSTPVSSAGETGTAGEPGNVVTSVPMPIGLRARELIDRLVLEWRVVHGTSDNVRFIVIREAISPGESRQWTTRWPTVEDDDPPPGHPLVYRVQSEDEHTRVRSESAELRDVFFIPPLADFEAMQARDGRVVGHWRAHPALFETRVVRLPAGEEADQANSVPIQSHRDGFEDKEPPVGQHRYYVEPRYRGPRGQIVHPQRQAFFDVQVAERPPVPQLTIDGSWVPGEAAVSFRWNELPPGVSMVLRRATVEPAGQTGDSLTIEEVMRTGEPAGTNVAVSGTAATVELPAGRWIIVPFTGAGNLAVRGTGLTIDIIPPVTDADVTRNGPDVDVTWIWPNGLRLTEVIWNSGGTTTRQEVTFSDFERRGCVSFKRGEAAEISIKGLVRSGREVLISAPVTVAVPAQTPTISFKIRHLRPGQLLETSPVRIHGLRWWCARRRVIITADLPCAGMHVEICLRSSKPADPVVLEVAQELQLGPGLARELVIILPKLESTDRNYYLFCRVKKSPGPVRIDNFNSMGREVRPCFG